MIEVKNTKDLCKIVEEKVIEGLEKIAYGEIHITVTMHNGAPVKLGSTLKEHISSSDWDKIVIQK